MNQIITIIQGNYGYAILFTCQDANGVVVNLTNSVITIVAQLVDDSSVNFTTNMSIVNAVSGTCQYIVGMTDFPVVGTYNSQINVNYNSGTEIVTFPGPTIQVLSELPI